MLKEIYSLIGVLPKIPGADTYIGQRSSTVAPPPKGPAVGMGYSAPPMPANNIGQLGPPSGVSNYGQSMGQPSEPPQMFNTMSAPNMGPPQMTVSPGLPPLSGPPPFSMGQPPQAGASIGPPPMMGFVKKS